MIILIPLGGIGQRFKDNGYKEPKALIKVSDKPILFWLLDNLQYNDKIDFIYIPYNKEYLKYKLKEQLFERYPKYKFKFLILEENTRGAAETIHIALNYLIGKQICYPNSYNNMKQMNDKPILCVDSDNFYTSDIITQWNGENCVFYFNDINPNPIFSYLKIENENILDIFEKEKVSNLTCTGAYGFNSYYKLSDYCHTIITKNIKQKNEFYTSSVIREMIKDGIRFKPKNICNKDYFSLGTPNHVNDYEYTFLFDLDGTLVDTDHIYIKVWENLLKDYNLLIDEKFFNNFIKGKSDTSFLKFLIPEITDIEIKNISISKDSKFITYLKESNVKILLDGVLEFFQKIKNRRIAIVTSCNKSSAEFILKKTGLDEYINILITANDCIKHKPHHEPYEKAINILNVVKKNCIIFEDSISGYLSAKNTNVYKICIVCNDKSSEEIKNLDVFKFINYKNLDLIEITTSNYTSDNLSDKNIYTNLIKNKLSYLPIKKISYNGRNIKAGYICDIDSYKITYTNNSSENIILKISNFDNELSKTAIKLNMYKNEAYFYEVISHVIHNINIPKNFGIITLENKVGILLEDVTKYNGIFNINLNNNINLLLKVINDIHKMHNLFYFNNEHEIINCMKKLLTVNKINYYKELIENRFDKFMLKNKILLTENSKNILTNIYKNFPKILDSLSQYPLNFCHGDLKSPNIFYNDQYTYFLDWQYIHLNKGVSDIVFLLVESINFNENIVTIVEKYYYKLIIENGREYSYDNYLKDFKTSLCMFPFFVCVWFNSEDPEKLLDKVFPIKFMRNLLSYYDFFLDDIFFKKL